MSDIILPGTSRWYDMVSPRAWEMPDFLKLAGQGWRTPKRKWEQLWMEQRGNFNKQLGRRVFKGPKFQRGVLHPVGFWFEPPAAGPATNLSNVTHTHTEVAPTVSTILLGYDTNGHLEWDAFGGVISNLVWGTLTTGSDDANDHTDEWWDANPSTNIGASYDLQYNTVTETNGGGGTVFHYFKDGTATNRTISTWYLISTVDADRANGSNAGGIGLRRGGGTAKSPDPGTSRLQVDVDIRATGTGSALATHSIDFTCTNS